MKTRLFLAAALRTLAATATAHAADGYDKTGSAAFTARAHTSTAAGTYAADSVDTTITVAAADGIDKTATGKSID